MGKYREKPVVIEAWRFVGFDGPFEPQPMWLHEAIDRKDLRYVAGARAHYVIETPSSGTMRVDLGDWIIQSVKGDLYPCKPDIFGATYDEAEEIDISSCLRPL